MERVRILVVSLQRPWIVAAISPPCLPSMGSRLEPQEESMPAPWPRHITIARLVCGFGVALLGMLRGHGPRRTKGRAFHASTIVPSASSSASRLSSRCWRTRTAHGSRSRHPPHAHASGVRLFAFRSSKAELTCEQLAHGRKEAEGAPKALKGGQGLSPAQISRASMFAAEVNKELSVEMKKRRCKA